MKKLMCLCMIMISVFLSVAEARADVIVVPDNSFLTRYEQECEYADRNYIANGPDGEVTVYKSPLSSKVVGRIENGQKVDSAWTFEDRKGIEWVYYNTDCQGWVPKDYMLVVYDYISFEHEFGAEFVSEHGQVSDEYNNIEIRSWLCPGGKEGERIFVSSGYRPEYDTIYKDEDGRTWAYTVYYMGYRNFWMCLDDLTASFEELYPNGSDIPEVEPMSADSLSGEPIVPSISNSILFVGFGIVGVVLITIIVLVILKKKMQFKGR